MNTEKKIQLVYNWNFIPVWNNCRNGYFKKSVEINRGWGISNTVAYFVWILTCCIIFQFEASFSANIIRMKINKELISWRHVVTWQRITTVSFSQHWWCIWTTIKNCQGIPAIKNQKNVVVWSKLTIYQVQQNVWSKITYLQLTSYSTSKCRKFNWINCPIGTWIFQVQSIPFW